MKNLCLFLHKLAQDGWLLDELSFLRLEKLIGVLYTQCFCYRQMFPVPSVYYVFNSPCVAIRGLRNFVTKRSWGRASIL